MPGASRFVVVYVISVPLSVISSLLRLFMGREYPVDQIPKILAVVNFSANHITDGTTGSDK
jgi:hypothetical protein